MRSGIKEMKITKTSNSRLSSTDFSRLSFGRIFSDHMLICHYKDGKWLAPKIQPYGPINMFPGTQVLHYGQSVFEGMKAFKNRPTKSRNHPKIVQKSFAN